MKFEIQFTGHKNIRSLHTKTIEITKEATLTLSGDCIIGVNATCGCKEIPKELKKKLQDSSSKIKFSLIVGPHTIVFHGHGDDKLTLTHPEDIVIRKSSFICPRTLAINCDMTSDVLPRKIIQYLQDPKATGQLIIEVD